jgi:hypothetical protein
MNNWSKRPSVPLNVPHPESPAGRSFDWSALGVPHPNFTAGRMLRQIEARPAAAARTSEVPL